MATRYTIPTAVSIVVPARNEQPSISRCLASLVRQEGVSFELIVVDDSSTDDTRALAASFPGTRVISAAPLQPGWTGKCNAMATGAQLAQGKWLLFTDADTAHAPGSLAAAIQEAEQHNVAMLSYSPRQQVQGFFERAVMPLVFSDLARRYSPTRVNDPQSPLAAANGQYILIRRDVYRMLGGHAPIAAELLEDVALARRVKQAGGVLRFRYNPAICTRMYRGLRNMTEGWTKNLALLFPDAPRLAILRALEFTAFATATTLLASGIASDAAALTWMAAAIGGVLLGRFVFRVLHSRFDPLSLVLSPLGLPMYAALLLRSWRAHRRGSVEWKGRSYSARAT